MQVNLPNATKSHQGDTAIFIWNTELGRKTLNITFSADEISISLERDHEVNFFVRGSANIAVHCTD